MPDRIWFSTSNKISVPFQPKKLEEVMSEAGWSAYNSSKFNLFPFPTNEKNEIGENFSVWDGKTYYMEEFENGCKKFIPSKEEQRPITVITENYSYAFTREQLFKLFWRMKGMKLKIENASDLPEPTLNRYSIYSIEINKDSGGQHKNYKNTTPEESPKKENEINLIFDTSGGVGAGGGTGTGSSAAYDNYWQISIDGCSVSIDFQKPVLKTGEDEYRPFIYCSCCQTCAPFIIQFAKSVGCSEACGFEGFQDYPNCSSNNINIKRKFRKKQHQSQYSPECGTPGGIQTITYAKCDCTVTEDTPPGFDPFVGYPSTETINSETSKTLSGKCTNQNGDEVDDVDTITLSDPWTIEELIQCAEDNYADYENPVFPVKEDKWESWMPYCGAFSYPTVSSIPPCVDPGGGSGLVYTADNLFHQNAIGIENFYSATYIPISAYGDPCLDVLRPKELDAGKPVDKSGYPIGSMPIVSAIASLNGGATVVKAKWRIAFIPPISCYLKIWLKKVSVHYDPYTGEETKREVSDLTPFEWSGGSIGECSSASNIDNLMFSSQQGEEIMPETSFQGNCGGRINTYIYVSKYSCQPGYEPKEISCKEIKDYQDNPTNPKRTSLWQRNCLPDWVFDQNEEFNKIPKGGDLIEWVCDQTNGGGGYTNSFYKIEENFPPVFLG